MRFLAQFISWIFLPLLMPVYGIATAMYIPSIEPDFFQQNTLFWMNPSFKLVVLAWFFIFSFLAPAMSLLILKMTNTISTIEVDDRSERATPIAISAIFCLILGLLFIVKAPNGMLPISIYALPWGGFISIMITLFLTRKDKVSLHALGVGMLFGFFVAYYSQQAQFYFEILIYAILVSGLVMSARVYLGKHTLKQVFVGFFVGFLSVSLTVFFFSFFR